MVIVSEEIRLSDIDIRRLMCLETSSCTIWMRPATSDPTRAGPKMQPMTMPATVPPLLKSCRVFALSGSTSKRSGCRRAPGAERIASGRPGTGDGGAVELPGIEGGLNGAACANRVHRGMREALQRGDPGSKLVEIWQAERRTPVGHLCHVNEVPGRDVDEDVTRSRAKMPLRAIVCEKQRSGLKVCTCIQRVP